MQKSYATDSYILNINEFNKKPKRKQYRNNTMAFLCTDPLRKQINIGYCDYKKTTPYNRNPCDYVENVETEFYLRHGQNSQCNMRWKERHLISKVDE